MISAARRFGAGIVGGDTSRSEKGLVINITVLGCIRDVNPVTRSGALPGHRIFVTGDLGGSGSGKHLDFVPRVSEGLFINKRYRPSAMIDISDGLAIDLSRVLDASGVGAVIQGEAVPVSPAARVMAGSSGKSPLEHALSDGEDFELLFTLPAQSVEKLINDPELSFRITQIGEIRKDPKERIIMVDALSRALGRDGYDHRI